MKITIITLFPEMFSGFLSESIVKRAQDAGLVNIELINLRQYAVNEYGSVDDRPFGGGAGMVIMADPVVKAIRDAKAIHGPSSEGESTSSRVLLMSPRGSVFNQAKARELSKAEHIVLVAGHYEAVDERVMEHVDEELSIGDYVLTGGELPAAVITDAIVRLIPGVLKKEDATDVESFFEVEIDELISAVSEVGMGSDSEHADEAHLARLLMLKKTGISKVRLLEFPHYTRPQVYEGKSVPNELLSGDPKRIRTWQLREAYKKTLSARPDLLSVES